jgi:hypothetical protein
MSEPDIAAAQDDLLSRASWAQLKKLRRNTVKSVRLTLRGDLLDEVEQLEEVMRREAETDKWENREPVAPQIGRHIHELEEEARESETIFRFEGLGQGEFALLQAAHPATDEVRKRLGLADDQPLQWNPETFPPALMAASCIEPIELKNNVAEFAEIQRTWSSGQVQQLWDTCLTANVAVAETPKSSLASEASPRRSSKNS